MYAPQVHGPRTSIELLFGAALVAGCTDVTTEIQVKDPAAVSVRVPSKNGTGAIVLPSGAEPAEVPLPKGEPPYEPGVMFDASAIRRTSGGVTLRCDACVGTPTLVAVPDSGLLTDTVGWSTRLHRIITVHGDTATISRVSYPYLVPAGKTSTSHTAFVVDVVTPTANIVYARRGGGDTHVGGYVATTMGVLILGAATLVFYDAAHTSSAGNPAVVYGGGALTALLGLGVVLAGVGAIMKPPVNEMAWPPPEKPADKDAKVDEKVEERVDEKVEQKVEEKPVSP